MKNYKEMFYEVKNVLEEEIVLYSSSICAGDCVYIMGKMARMLRDFEKQYGSNDQWETVWNNTVELFRECIQYCKDVKAAKDKYYFNKVLCKIFKKRAETYNTYSSLATMMFVHIEPILDEYTGSNRFE